MLKKLSEMLSPMQGKNVDIMIESNTTITSISTESFDCSVDDLYLILGNNCKDCQFESKFITDHIIEIDDSDYEDDDTIIIKFFNGVNLYLTKI